MNKKFKIKKKKLLSNFIFFILNFILFTLLILPLWLNKKFGFIYFEQFKFNIVLLYNGYLDGDSNLINSAIKWLIVVPLILSIVFIYIKKLVNFLYINQEISIDLLINKLKTIRKNFNKFYLNKIVFSLNLLINKLFYLIILILIIIFYFSFTNFYSKPDDVSRVDYLDLNYVYPDISSSGNNSNLIILYV